MARGKALPHGLAFQRARAGKVDEIVLNQVLDALYRQIDVEMTGSWRVIARFACCLARRHDLIGGPAVPSAVPAGS
jgi:hypothetical protein